MLTRPAPKQGRQPGGHAGIPVRKVAQKRPATTQNRKKHVGRAKNSSGPCPVVDQSFRSLDADLSPASFFVRVIGSTAAPLDGTLKPAFRFGSRARPKDLAQR